MQQNVPPSDYLSLFIAVAEIIFLSQLVILSERNQISNKIETFHMCHVNTMTLHCFSELEKREIREI